MSGRRGNKPTIVRYEVFTAEGELVTMWDDEGSAVRAAKVIAGRVEKVTATVTQVEQIWPTVEAGAPTDVIVPLPGQLWRRCMDNVFPPNNPGRLEIHADERSQINAEILTLRGGQPDVGDYELTVTIPDGADDDVFIDACWDQIHADLSDPTGT